VANAADINMNISPKHMYWFHVNQISSIH